MSPREFVATSACEPAGFSLETLVMVEDRAFDPVSTGPVSSTLEHSGLRALLACQPQYNNSFDVIFVDRLSDALTSSNAAVDSK